MSSHNILLISHYTKLFTITLSLFNPFSIRPVADALMGREGQGGSDEGDGIEVGGYGYDDDTVSNEEKSYSIFELCIYFSPPLLLQSFGILVTYVLHAEKFIYHTHSTLLSPSAHFY